MTGVLLAFAVLAASPAASQTAGFNSDGSAYAGMKPQGSGSPSAPSAAAPPTAQQSQVNSVLANLAGSVIQGAMSAPATAPYVHTAPKPVVGDDDESTAGPSGSADAQDIIKNYHPDAPAKAPFDQDASIALQRAFVKKKVKYLQGTCDPTESADVSKGVDCSCLMLIGNPDYFKDSDGNYVRKANDQHAFMVARGNDSLSATELQKGDVLFFRDDIDNPQGHIVHTGRVGDLEECSSCGGCSGDSGDVCVSMIHAPHQGTVVSEVKTVLHKDQDAKGSAVYCTHMKDGSISQCLTGAGRFP